MDRVVISDLFRQCTVLCCAVLVPQIKEQMEKRQQKLLFMEIIMKKLKPMTMELLL